MPCMMNRGSQKMYPMCKTDHAGIGAILHHPLDRVKTDTLRYEKKFPSYRGVRLTEAFEISHINAYETPQIPFYAI